MKAYKLNMKGHIRENVSSKLGVCPLKSRRFYDDVIFVSKLINEKTYSKKEN